MRYERVCQTRRETRRVGGPRQGLRVREGTVRRSLEGRLQDRGAREDQDDRHPRLRRSRTRSTSGTSKRPYYLQAGKGAERAYALLREAIRDSGRIGIAKIILREAQHLAAVEAIGDALVLTMMRFADELADLADFTFPRRATSAPAELKMARQLIDNLAAEWNPDEVHRRVQYQPDESHQRQGQGQAAAAVGRDHRRRDRRKSLT